MTKILLMVPETYESVTRPVITEIARQLLKATGLSENTNILYPSELEKEAQLGSRISGENEKTRFPSSERIFLEVEENYENDRILSTAVYRPENNFIFKDDLLQTYIKPAYSTTDITINFKYRAKDQVSAKRWRDDIRERISLMRDVNTHDASYHYLIPKEFLMILQEIHRLRENVAGYNEDYLTYFKNHATQRASLLTNLSGTKDAWGISETQMRLTGWFDFESGPENGSRENDTDSWTITFSYRFKYDKPIACVMHYPLMVHNQPLSKKFRETKLPYDTDQQKRSYSLSTWYFGAFEKRRHVEHLSQLSGIGIPEVDDFIPNQVVPNTMRIFTSLIQITEENRRNLLNLTALGKYELIPEVIDFLKTEAPFMTQMYQSIFVLSLYRGVNLVPSNFLTVDDALDVRATEDLNLREYYHVRLSLVTDLTLLTREAIDRLRHHGNACQKLIETIDPTLKNQPPIIGGDYIGKRDLENVIDLINRHILSKGDKQIRQFNTVEVLLLQAYKLKQPV